MQDIYRQTVATPLSWIPDAWQIVTIQGEHKIASLQHPTSRGSKRKGVRPKLHGEILMSWEIRLLSEWSNQHWQPISDMPEDYLHHLQNLSNCAPECRALSLLFIIWQANELCSFTARFSGQLLVKLSEHCVTTHCNRYRSHNTSISNERITSNHYSNDDRVSLESAWSCLSPSTASQ